MFGVAYLIQFPDGHEPRMESLELFNSFDDAEIRTREIIFKFIEEYGDDVIEYASKEDPVAIMYNGDVTAYVYIKEVNNDISLEKIAKQGYSCCATKCFDRPCIL